MRDALWAKVMRSTYERRLPWQRAKPTASHMHMNVQASGSPSRAKTNGKGDRS